MSCCEYHPLQFRFPSILQSSRWFMPIVLLCLCFLVTVGVILWAVRRTKASRTVPTRVAPVVLDTPLTPDQVSAYCEDGQLVCRPGFLQLTFSETFEVEDAHLGCFVGYAKADAQHNAVILVSDQAGLLRGRIASQPQLYEILIASRRSACYGVVRKCGGGFGGDVCIRVR